MAILAGTLPAPARTAPDPGRRPGEPATAKPRTEDSLSAPRTEGGSASQTAGVVAEVLARTASRPRAEAHGVERSIAGDPIPISRGALPPLARLRRASTQRATSPKASADAPSTAAAAFACVVDTDCDDCNSCTLDTCTAGICSHVGFADGAECDDGLFCNGLEACQGGVCLPTFPLDCGAGVCDERNDKCVTPCTTDADCDDGETCNGVETCDAATGLCRGGVNPCGAGASCAVQPTCVGGTTPGGGCLDDADCGLGGTCTGPSALVCGVGRCCDLIGTCSRNTKPNCSGTWLAVGGSGTTCVDEPCPVYGSGIAPQGTFVVSVGPISDFLCDPLQSLGDDYGVGDGTGFVELHTVRWAGGVDRPGDVIALEWYDAGGAFIEDEFFAVPGAGLAVHTFDLPVPLVIPATGFFVVRVAEAVPGGARIQWLSTAAVDVGSNDASILWVNGAPVANVLGQCAGGLRDDQWCDVSLGDSDCPGGACAAVANILSFEFVGTPGTAAPLGGCCDVVSGTCTLELPWICEGRGDIFRGVGTACAVCLSGGPNDGQPCTVDTDCTDVGAVCAEASCFADPSLPCLSDAECTATPDDFCLAFAGCTTRACCVVDATLTPDPGDQNGDCVEVRGIGNTCPTGATTRGLGTSCEPNLCPQPFNIGGDNCRLITPPHPRNQLVVPNLGDPPVTVTMTGNNTSATFDDWNNGECVGGSNDGAPCFPNPAACVFVGGGTFQCNGGANDGAPCTVDADCNPQQCPTDPGDPTNTGTCKRLCGTEVFNPNGTIQDPGWWESFTIDRCADVRVDLCGSSPAILPAWSQLYTGCPCEAVVANEAVNAPVGIGRAGRAGETRASFGQGAPFCDDDNAWQTFRQLPAGTYYYPIFSAPTGSIPPPIVGGLGGGYQMHVSVQACEQAACCLEESRCVGLEGELLLDPDGNPISCDDPTNPCVTGTCAFCAVDSEPNCDNAGGFWLAEENTPDAFCEGGDHNGLRCADDADCPGGAFCRPFGTVVSCNLGGGLTPCDTGACCTGSGQCVDQGIGPIGSMDRDTCVTVLEGTFLGGVKCAFDAVSCPICAIETASNCQPAGGSRVLLSDVDAGLRRADDFVPFTGDTLTDVCLKGSWIGVGEGEPGRIDCACRSDDGTACVPIVKDQFVVTVYRDAGGLPGTQIVGSSTATMLRQVDQPGANFDLYDITLVLDTPILGLIPGDVHWLEVTNNTDRPAGASEPTANECDWYWAESLSGNRYSARTEGAVYTPDGAGTLDLGFCVNTGAVVPSAPVGACCRCFHGGCVEVPLADCIDPAFPEGGAAEEWTPGAACSGTCPGLAPASDSCDPLLTPNPGGSLPFDNRCAGTDGPATVVCDGSRASFGADLWYLYTPPCNGLMTASICDGTDFDAIIALYGTESPSCVCPVDGTTQLECDDNGCGGLPSTPSQCDGGQCNTQGGGAILWHPVTSGNCYTIRVGGVNGAQGTGQLAVSCVEPVLYVDSTSTGANNGTSWADAYTDLQDALEAAAVAARCPNLPFDIQIWVAAGTYRPDRGTDDPASTFRLSSRVALYGGFDGTEVTLSDRHSIAPPMANPTVLTGNVYHVVTASGTDASAILDGFIIERGQADGPPPDDRGGGLLIENAAPTIVNCIFRLNMAAASGGAVASLAGSPSFTNCLFSFNTASGGGGAGLSFEGTGNATLTNCTVALNQGFSGGGGIGVALPPGSGPSVTVKNCVLWGNMSDNALLTVEDAQIRAEPFAVNVAFNCIEGVTGRLGGSGNIGGDPLFIDPAGGDFEQGTNDDNFRLGPGSACIDAGDTVSVPADVSDTDGDGDDAERLPFDLDAEPRLTDDGTIPDTGRGCPAVVDMGAYEILVDCNANGIPDRQDIASLSSRDCNKDRIPDECVIEIGTTTPSGPGLCDPGVQTCDPDCNGNGIPDECDFDCDANGNPDVCDIEIGTMTPQGPGLCDPTNPDCAPDCCDPDCNGNGVPDACDVAACGPFDPDFPGCDDCNQNGTPDACDIADGTSLDDVAPFGVPDECADSKDGVSGNWSDGAIWVNEAPPGATAGVTVNSANVTLDVNATVSALRLRRSATMTANAGDLSIAAGLRNAGEFMLDNHRITTSSVEVNQGGRLDVQGSAVVDAKGGTLSIDEGGKYESSGTNTVSAALEADCAEITLADPFNCSRMSLRDGMTVVTTGDFELDGRSREPLVPCSELPAGAATGSTVGWHAHAGVGMFDRSGTSMATPAWTMPPGTASGGALAPATSAVLGGKTSPILRLRGPASALNAAGRAVAAVESTPLDVKGAFRILHSANVCVGCDADVNDGLAKVLLEGDFDNRSKFASQFDWLDGGLRLEGPPSTPQTFEVAGLDLGPVADGFTTSEPTAGESCFVSGTHTNFSVGVLEVAAGTKVRFENSRLNTAGTAPCSEALYVRNLKIEDNAQLTFADCRVYYETREQGSNVQFITEGCGALLPIGRSAFCPIPSPVQMVEISNAFGAPVQAIKQRVLSFSSADPGLRQALRVSVVSLPGPFAVFTGFIFWAGPPQEFSESGGRGYDRPCTASDPCSGATYWSSTLQCSPFFTDWNQFGGPIHLRDNPLPTAGTPIIIPLGVYDLQFVEETCILSDESSFGPALRIINPRWADNGTFGASGQFLAPDGSVDVATDLVASLDKFRGLPGAASKTHFDMLGVFASVPQSPILDGKITVSETTAILDEFRGVTNGYPFTPTGTPCPASALGDRRATGGTARDAPR